MEVIITNCLNSYRIHWMMFILPDNLETPKFDVVHGEHYYKIDVVPSYRNVKYASCFMLIDKNLYLVALEAPICERLKIVNADKDSVEIYNGNVLCNNVYALNCSNDLHNWRSLWRTSIDLLLSKHHKRAKL